MYKKVVLPLLVLAGFLILAGCRAIPWPEAPSIPAEAPNVGNPPAPPLVFNPDDLLAKPEVEAFSPDRGGLNVKEEGMEIEARHETSGLRWCYMNIYLNYWGKEADYTHSQEGECTPSVVNDAVKEAIRRLRDKMSDETRRRFDIDPNWERLMKLLDQYLYPTIT